MHVFLAAVLTGMCLWGGPAPGRAEQAVASGVRIVAPDGIRTQVYAEPGGDIIDVALNGAVLQLLGSDGDYLKVRLPDSQKTGYVLKAHTEGWTPPPASRDPKLIVGIVGALVIIAAVAGLIVVRRKKAEEIERRTALINKSIKEGEDLFRSGDYPAAIEAFKTYLDLHGGEVRNPDVYRRLSLCYLRTHEPELASAAWDKMSELGGAKSIDDYTLGVDIMSAQGEDARACRMYETILTMEIDEDKLDEIKRKLIEMYRKLKDTHNLLRHAVDLLSTGVSEPQLLADTANYLMVNRETGMALKANHKDLIQRICDEFLEENNLSSDAERIYLKALEYNRTDPRIHKILAQKYRRTGEFKKAISELTILHQIDKDKSDDYVEEAAKLYIESGKIEDALKEGNPKIIRKIAQTFIARSHVHPEAVAVYEKVLEFQPNAVGVRRVLSTVYLTRGDLPRYMAELRTLHEIDGENKDYLTDLARCVIDNNLVEETMREGNKSLNTKILKQLIKKKAHDDQTVAIFKRLLEIEPQNAILLKALAGAHNLRGEAEEELRYLLTLTRLRPGDEESAERVAELALETGRLSALLDEASPSAIKAAVAEIKKRKLSGPEYDMILYAGAGGTSRKPPAKARRVDSNVKERPSSLRPAPPAGSRPRPVAPVDAAPEDVLSADVRKSSPELKTQAPLEVRPPDSSGSVEPVAGQRAEAPPQAVYSSFHGREDVPRGESTPAPEESAEISAPDYRPSPTARPLQTAPQALNLVLEGESASAGVPVTTFVSSFERTESRPADGMQVIDVTGPKILRPASGENPLTTFVSASAKTQRSLSYREDELFRPHAGGTAYATLKTLSKDAWGSVRAVVEVTTTREYLMRTFEKGLMKSAVLEDEAMEDFSNQIVAIAGVTSHTGIAKIEERVVGPGRMKGLIYAFRGHTLDELLRESQRPRLPVVIGWARQIVDALVYADSFRGLDGARHKLRHGDLQASQTFIGQDMTEVKLAGFGYTPLYRSMSRAKGPRWKEQVFCPAYMPPEAFRAKDAGIEELMVDVYAFGVLFYQAATWRTPFSGPELDDFKFQHSRLDPEPPSNIDPSLPAWIEEIIMTCLEKDPVKRWSGFAEIQDIFRREQDG
jgi:tetratricopeptide (TPR) repeat protein